MSKEHSTRESWKSNIGFILAASGSAVGLGNIWRFPYLTGENGGASFVLVYIIMLFLVGLPILVAELTLGRKSRMAPIPSFIKLGGSKFWAVGGILGVITNLFIYSFYIVVGGWTVAYVIKELFGIAGGAEALEFATFISSVSNNLIYAGIFSLLTCIIVLGGVRGGLEKLSVTLMPVLLVMLVLLALRSVTLDGAMGGLIYYLKPDFASISFSSISAALSQLFFSLSVCMGAMLTYATYTSKSNNLIKDGIYIGLMDTTVALLAGFIIFPAAFAFAISPGVGPALVFITMPTMFAKMPFGTFFGIIFFVLLFFAAITSSIALLETCVTSITDYTKKISRKLAIFIVAVFTFIVFTVPYSMATAGVLKPTNQIFAWFISNFDGKVVDITLLSGGFIMSILAGWKVKGALVEELRHGSGNWVTPTLGKVWIFWLQYVIPTVIGFLLLKTFGFF